MQAIARGSAERRKTKEWDSVLTWDNGDHGGADYVPGTEEEVRCSVDDAMHVLCTPLTRIAVRD